MDQTGARWDAAITVLREGRAGEAESLMRDLAAVRPLQPERAEILGRVIYNRAVAAFQVDGVDVAEPLVREALALAPTVPDLRSGLSKILYLRAIQREADSDWDAAAKAVLEAARLEPTLGQSFGSPAAALADRLHAQGIEAVAGEPVTGCRLLMAAWALAPSATSHYAPARSAFVHLGTGELGTPTSVEAFQTLLAADPTDVVALIGLANLRRRQGRHNEAESLCLRALKHWPENPFALGRLGSILSNQGRYCAADRLYQDLGRRYGGVEAQIRLTPDFIEGLRSAAAASDPLGAPDRETAEGARLVVFSACDVVYFHRFADAFANSLAKSCRSIKLHLHVIDPDPAVDERVRSIRQRLPGLPVRLTTEPVPEGIRPDQRKTYFSCCRFLHLPRLIAAYRVPVLMLDIDMVVLRDVQPLADRLQTEAADLALVQQDGDNLWSALWADAVLAGPSPRSIEYFELVRRYIGHFFAVGHVAWFLDQIALFAVKVTAFRDCPAPLILSLPTDSQNSHTEHAYFWSLHVTQPSNAAGPESEFYLRYKNNTI